MDMFHREALRIPADATANLKADAVTRTANTDAQEWGDCPRCGQPVRKTGRMWQCSTNKTEKTKDGKWATTAGCGWKMFARIAGKTITDQTARRLLAGQSVTLKGFTSKSGKKFDAAISSDREIGAFLNTFDKLAAMPEPTPAKQEKDELSAGACDPADPLNLEQSSSYGMTR